MRKYLDTHPHTQQISYGISRKGSIQSFVICPTKRELFWPVYYALSVSPNFWEYLNLFKSLVYISDLLLLQKIDCWKISDTYLNCESIFYRSILDTSVFNYLGRMNASTWNIILHQFRDSNKFFLNLYLVSYVLLLY